MAVLSSVRQEPKFVTDPVLKAAKERQPFLDSQVLANPSFTASDDFISVVGAKALGVTLDPETGRMPKVPEAEVPELAGSAEFLELGSSGSAGQTDADRIEALEEQLAALSSEQTAEIERVKAQAFAEGQAQGQLEAKQLLERESETACRARRRVTRHGRRADQRSAKPPSRTPRFIRSAEKAAWQWQSR